MTTSPPLLKLPAVPGGQKLRVRSLSASEASIVLNPKKEG